MKQVTRPPAQYIIAPGTQFRLVANDYDKNKYAQCRYESQRTLIRCKQIRSKEDLAKRGGICEEHIGISKLLETNHKKEIMRCHAENDTKMQRRRFDPWITSNEYISDEDDYLQSIHDVPPSSQEWANNSILENHPLRHAEVFTEKDVLKIKMELVQKDIDDLIEFKRLVTAHAQKEHDLIDSDEDEDLPTDMAQRRIFNSARRYGRKDYLTLTTIDPVYKQCCVGPEMTDRQVIDHIILDLLDKIDGKEKASISVEKQCGNSALQLTEFCFDHILMDRKQKIFAACVECGLPAFLGEPTKCSLHIKECEKTMNKCTCPKCAPDKQKELSRANSRAEINIMDDDEGALGNLSRIETMTSPMQQFPSNLSHPSSSNSPQHRRYHGPPAQLLRPSTMGLPPGQVLYHKQHSRLSGGPPGQAYLASHEYRDDINTETGIEDESISQTCARVRPLEPTQYGEGKKKLQLQKNIAAGSSRQTMPYHMQQIKTSTIISPPEGQKMTFQGWKNQAATSGGPRQMYSSGFGSTRYPMQNSRQHPPPPPKQIPLNRVHDSRSHPEHPDDPATVRYSPVEPQRRGVPYYKNASFRKTELTSTKQQPVLTPSTSTSSSQLLGPPQSPQHNTSPKMYRPPQSRLPMAPHRAIAAGLNPADVGGLGGHHRSMSSQQQFRTPTGSSSLHHPPSTQQLTHQHQPHMYPPGLQTTSPRLQNLQTSSGKPSGGAVSYHVGTPLPPISLPRRAPVQMASYRVHNGPNGQRTTMYHPDIGEFKGPLTTSTSLTPSSGKQEFGNTGGAPLIAQKGFERSPTASEGGPLSGTSSRSPSTSSGVNAVVTALDSARHDSRFANINVRTFLSMGQMGQKDLSKMSQEEIEQMAAETEHEKVSRKGAISSGSSASSGGGGHRTPRTSFTSSVSQLSAPGPSGSLQGLPGSIGLSQMKPGTSRRLSQQYPPDSVKEVISSMISSETVQSQKNKRKLGDAETINTMKSIPSVISSSDPQTVPGEPIPKKMAPEEMMVKMEPSTSSTERSGDVERAQEQEGNPLDLLAELSAVAEAEEGMDLAPPPPPSLSPRLSTSSSRKTPRKTSAVAPRRSSSGKKKSEEQDSKELK